MQTVTNLDVSKDQVFKLRLDAEDRKRLDELAGHYSATAATVVRILIKEKHDALARTKAGPREVLLADEDPELYDRVVRAYVARAKRDIGDPDVQVNQPNRSLTTIDTSGEIVLRNTRGDLAHYRFKGGKLFVVKHALESDD